MQIHSGAEQEDRRGKYGKEKPRPGERKSRWYDIWSGMGVFPARYLTVHKLLIFFTNGATIFTPYMSGISTCIAAHHQSFHHQPS